MTNIVNYNQEYINSILSYFSYVDMNGVGGMPDFQGRDLSIEPNTRNFKDNYKNYLIKNMENQKQQLSITILKMESIFCSKFHYQ